MDAPVLYIIAGPNGIGKTTCVFDIIPQNIPIISKKKTTKTCAVVDPKVGNYEKHPFFVKKANEAKAILKVVGLPKKVAKAK